MSNHLRYAEVVILSRMEAVKGITTPRFPERFEASSASVMPRHSPAQALTRGATEIARLLALEGFDELELQGLIHAAYARVRVFKREQEGKGP